MCVVPCHPDCAFIIVVSVVRPWGVQRRGSDERTGQESDSAQRMALSVGAPAPQGKESLGRCGPEGHPSPPFTDSCLFKLTLGSWDGLVTLHSYSCLPAAAHACQWRQSGGKFKLAFNSKEFLNDCNHFLPLSALYIWEGWFKFHPRCRAAEWVNPLRCFDLWRLSPQFMTLLELGRD